MTDAQDFTDAELTDALLDLCRDGKLKMVPSDSGEWRFVAADTPAVYLGEGLRLRGPRHAD